MPINYGRFKDKDKNRKMFRTLYLQVEQEIQMLRAMVPAYHCTKCGNVVAIMPSELSTAKATPCPSCASELTVKGAADLFSRLEENYTIASNTLITTLLSAHSVTPLFVIKLSLHSVEGRSIAVYVVFASRKEGYNYFLSGLFALAFEDTGATAPTMISQISTLEYDSDGKVKSVPEFFKSVFEYLSKTLSE